MNEDVELILTLFVILFSFSALAANGKPSVYDRVMQRDRSGAAISHGIRRCSKIRIRVNSKAFIRLRERIGKALSLKSSGPRDWPC